MTYNGTVINGVVVLEGAAKLPEGTKVRIESEEPVATSVHFHPVGAWDGPAGEIDALIREVQDLRDADADPDRP